MTENVCEKVTEEDAGKIAEIKYECECQQQYLFHHLFIY